MNYKFSKHALEQMEMRDIPLDLVETILLNPNQLLPANDGTIYQSLTQDRKHLIRIFVNDINQVITVYRTSQNQEIL